MNEDTTTAVENPAQANKSVDGPFFKIVGDQPVPIRDGEVDGALSMNEIHHRMGWPLSALVALHQMFFPITDEELDGWVEALSHPPVTEMLTYFGRTLGDLEEKFLLLAMLQQWDQTTAEEKIIRIHAALQLDVTAPNEFSMMDNAG